MIQLYVQRSRNPHIKSFFASNQTFNQIYNQTLNQTVINILSLPLSSFLYQLGYNLFSYQLGYNLFLYRLRYNLLYSNTSSFWSKSPMYLTESSRLARKDYLQISVFLDPVVVKQKGIFHALWKATGEATNKVVKRRLAGCN